MKRLCIVSTYLPRICGIGSFASQLAYYLDSLEKWQISVIALVKDHGEPYGPEVIMQLRQDDRNDYDKAVRLINQGSYDAVILQHEFGLYGGADGEYVLDLAKGIRKPLFTVFHSAPGEVTPNRTRILHGLARYSRRMISLSQCGCDALASLYGIPYDRTYHIPNGVISLPTAPKEEAKRELGTAGRTVAMTFGLLNPGKGIEHVLLAMPEIVREHPDFLYQIVGGIHPDIRRIDGDAYLNGLKQLAHDLGLEAYVSFVDRYLDDHALIHYLSGADLYITPYRSMDQISSGTLTYAAHYGIPIVSTPYLHASELLGDGSGRLFPYGDVDQLRIQLSELLDNEPLRNSLGEALRAKTVHYSWPEVARHYSLFILSEIGGSRTRKRKKSGRLAVRRRTARRRKWHMTRALRRIRRRKMRLRHARTGKRSRIRARSAGRSGTVMKKRRRRSRPGAFRTLTRRRRRRLRN